MSWKQPLAAEAVRPDYLARNRDHWDSRAPEWVEMDRRAWAGQPSWGIWGAPESELGLLPDLDRKETLEVGCGTAYVSAWFARAGASPVGLDNSAAQLATASALQAEFNLAFPLVHGAGESLPFKEFRLRVLGVRICHLVRLFRVDSRGSQGVASRRRAHLPWK